SRARRRRSRAALPRDARRSRLRHQDAAAIVAERDGPVRRALDPLGLRRRDVEVASLAGPSDEARRADTARLGATAFVRRAEVGREVARQLAARATLLGDLAVERLALLHQRELVVLDRRAVTAELLDVRLHGLQLPR